MLIHTNHKPLLFVNKYKCRTDNSEASCKIVCHIFGETTPIHFGAGRTVIDLDSNSLEALGDSENALNAHSESGLNPKSLWIRSTYVNAWDTLGSCLMSGVIWRQHLHYYYQLVSIWITSNVMFDGRGARLWGMQHVHCKRLANHMFVFESS